MKLKNKKTREIGNLVSTNWDEVALKVLDDNGVQLGKYAFLAELNEEWEDYEEPKDIFWIDNEGTVCGPGIDYSGTMFEKNKEIGNYFETKEEAERAVEKLKAWKRLKDKGLKFTFTPGLGSLDANPGKFQIDINAEMPAKWFCCDSVAKDLDLLFGGEE